MSDYVLDRSAITLVFDKYVSMGYLCGKRVRLERNIFTTYYLFDNAMIVLTVQCSQSYIKLKCATNL